MGKIHTDISNYSTFFKAIKKISDEAHAQFFAVANEIIPMIFHDLVVDNKHFSYTVNSLAQTT